MQSCGFRSSLCGFAASRLARCLLRFDSIVEDFGRQGMSAPRLFSIFHRFLDVRADQKNLLFMLDEG